MTCSMEVGLGAYVLDALEPDEADGVRRHLSGCLTCQQELSSLSDTVAWLSLLLPGELEQLEERQQTADRRPRRRRRVLALVVAAGIAASVLAGAVATEDRTPPSNSALVHAVDPATHVRAAVTISEQVSGTRLDLSLSGAYPHGWCSLEVHSRDGRSETAATWLAGADGSAAVVGTTAIAPDELSELDVVTSTGEVLVSIPVTSAGTDRTSIPIRRTL
jgi:hypothetical protein